MGHYSTIKRRKPCYLLQHGLKLEGIMLSEMSDRKKKSSICSHLYVES